MQIAPLLKLSLSRLVSRREFKIVVTVSLLFVVVAFIETCLHFYHADVGELPSPAYGWAWNMDAMQVNAMRVYLYFFMPILAALVFSDNAYEDIRRGIASCIAARSSLTSYYLLNTLLSYLGGFLLVFATLALLQGLAFIAFPLDGAFNGYLNTPIYLDIYPEDGLLYDLMTINPYGCNLIYMLWTSLWAGACSLISYGCSFIFTKYRAISLVLPTLVSLVLFQLSPLISQTLSCHLHFAYCYPNITNQLNDPVFFAAVPIIITIFSLIIGLLLLRKGKDLLL